MFGKITKGISRAAGGRKGFKYRITIQVEKLDNLPAPVKKCRVVWSRGPKVQMTETKDVAKGAVIFHQQLSQIATMYKNAKDDFEPKEYKFQVQVPSKEGDGKLMTVGKADLDLSYFVVNEGQPQNKLIPIMFKVGAASTGYLKVSIAAEPVSGDVDDDGMTEVSALTGMTAHLDDDQDLSGFEDDEDNPKSGPKLSPSAQSSTNKRPASKLSAIHTLTPSPTPPAAVEPKPESAKPSKTDSKPASSSKKSSILADKDDGDISPMSMSPEDSPRELSRKGSREAGKQSTVASLSAAAAVSRATAGRADKDARSELFGTAPASSSQPAGRGAVAVVKTPSSKHIKELSDDEARSELFAAGASKARAGAGGSSSAAKPTSSTARLRSVPGGAAQPPATTPSSRANSSRPIGTPRSPSSRSDNSTSTAGGAQHSTAAGGSEAPRRGLLERPIKGSNAALPAAEALSSKQQPLAAGPRAAGVSAAGSARHHSLSDDEDEPEAQGNGLLKPITSRVSTATASRIPNMSGSGTQQQNQPSPRGAAGGAGGRSAGSDGDTAAMKQLAAENEKMKAQIAALKDQAAQAEDARRQARLAAENAAAERDDYKTQVQELEQQLKEVISTSVSAEEAQDLVQQVTALQNQLQQQHQGQQQQLVPPSTHDTAALQLQCQRQQENLLQSKSSTEELQRQLMESQFRSAELKQQLDSAQKEADEQYEQLQEQLRMQQDSMEQMKQLQQQLDDAMQLLEQQDAAAAAAAANVKPAAYVPVLSAMMIELREKLAKQEHATEVAQQQRDGVLALVLTEVHMTSQQEHVKRFVWDDELVDAAQRAVAGAKLILLILQALDGPMQEELQQVLVCFKAATAAAVEQATQVQYLQKQTTDLMSALDAAQSELQAAKSMQHQAASRQPEQRASREQEQPGMTLLKQQITQLEAEAAQLRADNQQLVQQRLQGRSLLDNQGPRPPSEHSKELDEPQPVQAGIVLRNDAHILGNDSQELSTQLTSSHRKVQQLIKTRDKLEIILKDFETSAAEEKEQFLVQLSAANQQLRRVTQQLEQVQRELAAAIETKQKLEQDLQNAEVALTAAELAAAEAREEHDLLQHALVEAQAAAATASAADGHTSASWSIPAQVIALADNAAANNGLQEALSSAREQAADFQKQSAEADSSKRALEQELGRLRKQLADEQAERATLDEQLAQHLEDTGDYTAQDTVAAFEAKYNRLKTRYRELTESHRDEITALHEEIAALQERVVDLEAAAAQLDAARSQAQHGEATLADALAKGSKTGAELAALRTENQQLMQSLVLAKLELAQVSEREVIGKRELYKAKETNMKLASKMTKLETLVYK